MSLKGPHIIVGLGNPGPPYADTRHNAGFKVVDELAREMGINYWKLSNSALIGEGSFCAEKIVLVKPQSFMNLSGGPVKGVLRSKGASLSDLLVVHDDLDLPVGVLRLKLGGGHGGHNGLRSLHGSLGADYARLRVGIGRPPGRMDAADFVLALLKGSDLEDFAHTCAQATRVVRAVMEDGLQKAMNECNQSEPAE